MVQSKELRNSAKGSFRVNTTVNGPGTSAFAKRRKVLHARGWGSVRTVVQEKTTSCDVIGVPPWKVMLGRSLKV